MSDGTRPPESAESIIGLLQAVGARTMTPPTRVASGWESVIWRAETDRGTVAIRVLADPDPAVAVFEARVIERLHALDYPVPAIVGVGRLHDRSAIVMEFVDGTDLWESGWAPERACTALAELMAGLHRLPAAPFDPQRPPMQWMERTIDRALERHPGFTGAGAWIRDRIGDVEPIVAPTHLDFPPNVLIRRDGSPAVIDWTSFRVTDTRLDLHWSRLLISMYGSPAAAEMFTAAYVEITGPSAADEWAFFETCSAFRRLAIVADMLDGADHEATDLESHLPIMAVPLSWIHRHAGTGIPEVESWLTRSHGSPE